LPPVKQDGSLSFEPRPDDSLKSLDLSLRHVVAAFQVVSREKEHVLNACLFPSLQQALGTTFRRTKESKCVGNLLGSILRDCRRIVALLKLESSLF